MHRLLESIPFVGVRRYRKVHQSVRACRDTQSGKVFRLRGKGISHLGGYGTGDEHVIIHVETPSHMNSEQKELLKKFAESGGEKVNPLASSFMGKVKDLFS